VITLKVVQGERLDYTPLKQNCVSCGLLDGNICRGHGAYLQTRGSTPNECKLYVKRGIDAAV